MQVTVPVKLNLNQGIIAMMGFTLVFDPRVLSYNHSAQVVQFAAGLGTPTSEVAFGDNYVAPYLHGVTIGPGVSDLVYVTLDVLPGASGNTTITVDGHIQPFTAYGFDYNFNLTANSSSVNLSNGTATPIVINAVASAQGAMAGPIGSSISNYNSLPIAETTPAQILLAPTPLPVVVDNPPVSVNPTVSPVVSDNPITNILDHAASAISTIGSQIQNTVSNITGGNATTPIVNTPTPLSANSIVPQSVSGLLSNPTALLIGIGLAIYFLKKK